jgi:hypothetical protein
MLIVPVTWEGVQSSSYSQTKSPRHATKTPSLNVPAFLCRTPQISLTSGRPCFAPG